MFLLSWTTAAVSLQPESLAPAQLEPGHPGRLCLSTATNIRTVTCNMGCNSNELHACPRACLCTAANITADVSRGMDSGAFRQLMGKLPKREPELPAVSAARLADPIAPAAPVSLPDDMTGFWMKTWACKDQPKKSWACAGPKSKNLNVVFSGYAGIEQALEAALFKDGDGPAVCTDTDKTWCISQADFMVSTTKEAKTQKEALHIICKKAGMEMCKRCFEPDDDLPTDSKHPYAESAGIYSGVPFLGIGGATGNGIMTVEVLDSFTPSALAAIKDAGFEGVAFDMEMTGDGEIVQAQDRAFANVKRAGLLVLVTTSHSAPYAAASEEIKEALVESWVRSNDIDIFSPQLYTSGEEEEPEYDLTACGAPDADNPEASTCTYERLASMKAKWVPSLSNGKQYPGVKNWFAAKGITTSGFMQWGGEADGM